MNKRITALAAAAAALLLLSGCSSDTPETGPSSDGLTPVSEDVLGTPNPATGEPVVAGIVNMESGPIVFSELRAGAEAAIAYANEYLGGIGGRPIELVHCESDGLPATSQRCANQVLDSAPAFIFGSADTGAPGAIPVWEGADLAVIGGVAFTPVESNYAKGVIFTALGAPDLISSAVFAADQGAESVAILYTDTTTGQANGAQIAAAAKNLGLTTTSIPVPPTAADLSVQAATVVAAQPDAVISATPSGCASMLKSLKQLGYAGSIFVLDNCTAPDQIAAAGDAAEGIMWAGPVDLPGADTDDAALFTAIMAKYAPDAPLDSLSAVGVQEVLNAVQKLTPIAADLSTESILAAFTSGSENPNFLAHPYTCDGQQLPGAASVCNAYERVSTWKGGKAVVLSDWLSPAAAMAD